MAKQRIIRFLLLGSLLVSFSLVGCSKEEAPKPAPPTAVDEAASIESIEVRVVGTYSGEPEIIDSRGNAALLSTGLAKMLVVRLEYSNTGEAAVPYTPPHGTELAPQLFNMPVEGEDRLAIPRVASSDPIFTVDQIQSETLIEPGKKVVDEYIFKVPNADAEELLLVISPEIFGKSGDPAYFALPNQHQSLNRPAPAKIGEVYKKEGLEVKVTGISDEFVEAVQLGTKKKNLKYPYAYTLEPIVKVAMDIKNTGKNAIIYRPGHRSSGSQALGVMMSVKGTDNLSLRRFQLADADAAAKGQTKGTVKIDPGQTIQDVFLFERPPTENADLELTLSAHLFGLKGLLEFSLPYKQTTPAAPDLEPYKKEAPVEEK